MRLRRAGQRQRRVPGVWGKQLGRAAVRRRWRTLFLQPFMMAACVLLGISGCEFAMAVIDYFDPQPGLPSCASVVLLPAGIVLALLAVWQWRKGAAEPREGSRGFPVMPPRTEDSE